VKRAEPLKQVKLDGRLTRRVEAIPAWRAISANMGIPTSREHGAQHLLDGSILPKYFA
jgi:hypothetical protein